MKILLIEDEEVLLRVLQEKLESENFNVQVALDGEAGMSAAKSFKPDMILLDLLLPKISGLEVLAILKEDSVLKQIPVIVLSNLSDGLSIKKALSLGAVDYLVKTQHPVNEVIEKINKHILTAK